MKPLEFVPPAIALVAAGVWLGSQSRSISSLVDENTVLRERIESARHAPASDDEHGKPSLSHGGNGTKGKKKIDWKQIALKQAAMAGPGDVSNMRAMIELQKILMAMTPEELMANLDEIAAMDLPVDAKRQLENMVIGIISQENPELVVQRFGDRIDDPQMSWQIPMSFQAWAKKDLAGAMAWMDKQVADGKFESKSLDGRNEARLRFEGGLVSALLESDPSAAAARVKEIAENDRSSLFNQGMFFRTKPGNEKAMADLIRNTLPENQRISTLASASSGLVYQGGYERVSGFMTAAGATAEERAAIVKQALQNKASQGMGGSNDVVKNFEEGRAWALKEAPDAINRITGESLGHITMRGVDYGKAAELAVKYHEQSGSDEVMIAFLGSHSASTNSDAALKLVDKISDEGKREEIRKQLEERSGGKPQPARTAE